MPIYEYHCEGCDHWQEEMFSFIEIKQEVGCRNCQGVAVKKIKTVPALCIPAKHCWHGSALKKYGITNPATGEGVKKKRRELI